MDNERVEGAGEGVRTRLHGKLAVHGETMRAGVEKIISCVETDAVVIRRICKSVAVSGRREKSRIVDVVVGRRVLHDVDFSAVGIMRHCFFFR